MSDADDGSIADHESLLRRIRPDQVVDDENLGTSRPSSAAFKDPNLSVDAEHILISNGVDWRFSLQGHSGYSLVKFEAGVARGLKLAVIHKPIVPHNLAHTEVVGKKTQGIANSLVSASQWVHLEPKP